MSDDDPSVLSVAEIKRIRRMGSFHAMGDGDAGMLGATIPPTRAITTIAQCHRETADEIAWLKGVVDRIARVTRAKRRQ